MGIPRRDQDRALAPPLEFYKCFSKHYLYGANSVNIDYFNITYILHREENYL
jgi:hypothetical protein